MYELQFKFIYLFLARFHINKNTICNAQNDFENLINRNLRNIFRMLIFLLIFQHSRSWMQITLFYQTIVTETFMKIKYSIIILRQVWYHIIHVRKYHINIVFNDYIVIKSKDILYTCRKMSNSKWTRKRKKWNREIWILNMQTYMTFQ